MKTEYDLLSEMRRRKGRIPVFDRTPAEEELSQAIDSREMSVACQPKRAGIWRKAMRESALKWKAIAHPPKPRFLSHE